MLTVLRRRGPIGVLGAGLRPLPGPALVLAANYQTSPVGPYTELTVMEPARLGARVGMSVTASVVNHAGARAGGQLNWGLPRELGALRWCEGSGRVSLAWDEGGVRIEAVASRRAVPVVVSLRSLQHRADGAVVAPLRLRGMGRPARVSVSAPRAWSGLDGAHRGIVLAAPLFRLAPARHPVGFARTLVAPLEPGLAQSVTD